MGKINTPRYFVAKRQKSRSLFYWQPSKSLVAAGFTTRRLAERTNDVAEAFREAEQLNRELDLWRSGAQPVQAGPGTLPDLIRRYQKTTRWTRLSPKTQNTYECWQRQLEAWSARAGHPPIQSISRKDCRALYESKAEKRPAAAAVLTFLSALMQFAVDEGEIQTNPARALDLQSNPPRYQVWTDEQIEAVIRMATEMGRPSVGLAIALAHNTAQRLGDIITMAWSQYDRQSIRLRQRKTGTHLDVPCTQQLKAVLDATPRVGTLMVMIDRTGRPYSDGYGFDELFRRIARAAGLPDDLQFRDLRRTAAVQLAEAGCSPPEIAAITGHSIERTAAILEVYCPRNSVMAGHAITKLEDYRKNKQASKLEGSS